MEKQEVAAFQIQTCLATINQICSNYRNDEGLLFKYFTTSVTLHKNRNTFSALKEEQSLIKLTAMVLKGS